MDSAVLTVKPETTFPDREAGPAADPEGRHGRE
jgi:hypothetical protein